MLVQITPEVKRSFRGANYALRTSSLFHDRWRLMMPEQQAKFLPVYSLHTSGVEIDGQELISAKETFLTEADPTGYRWAIKYLEGWQHWLRLMELDWFKTAVALWLSELDAKMAADAIRKIKDIASGGSPAAFSAAKYISDQGYKKGPTKRGRPSKIEIDNNLREATQNSRDLEEDFKRVTPHLVAVS